MIGASKILTVSYGTFSCTLEGFDEPFNTMKAIAEYFRDLAAEDRYFGAEPPTPDAAMLHKIAEREIQRRVEAKIQDNGVILRAAEGEMHSAPTAVAAAAIAPPPIAETPVQEVVAAQPAVSVAPQLDANGESVAARLSRLRAKHEGSTPAPEPAPEPASAPAPAIAAPVAEVPAIAEAAIAAPRAETVGLISALDDEDYSEDQHADDLDADMLASLAVLTASPEAEPAAPEVAEAEAISAAEVEVEVEVELEVEPEAVASQDDITAFMAQQTEAVEAPEAEAFAEQDLDQDAADLADLAAMDGVSNAREAAHEVAGSAEMLLADSAQDEDYATAAQVSEVGYSQFDDSDDLPEAAQDSDDALLAAFATPEPAQAPEPEAEPAREAEAEAEPEQPLASDTLSAEQALAEALGIDAPEARAMISEESEPAPEAVIEDRPRARARVIKVRRIQPIAPEASQAAHPGLLSAEAEAALQAELASLEDAGNPEPRVTVRPVRPTRPTRATAPEITEAPAADLDADLAATLQAMVQEAAEPEAAALPQAAETNAPAAHSEARHTLTQFSEDESVDRLLEQTNSEMDDPEARRRSAAISHLKAAVAATEAERQAHGANPPKPQPDRRDAYRNDLNSVVRPASGDLSGRAAGERPSPLVLVSEQRIDRVKPSDTATATTPPRIVMPARPLRAGIAAQDSLLGGDMDDEDLDLTAEESAVNLFAANQSFADFADQLGAESLHDLLEASAVYCAQVLGRPQFSRPLVMSQINTLPTAENHKLEEQLRAFGTLMREGRITKVKRGAFAVTERSPLLAEVLRNAG